VKGSIDVEKLDLVQSGSSNIRLSGKATKAEFNCSGSGNLQSPDLIIDYCEVSISGSGNADLTVEKELSGSLSGSGNIRYKGNAEITEKSISGIGKIKKINIP
jgi:Putative auto-transporter adhesin, head GIN domain